MSADETERAYALAREKELMDFRSAISESFEKGKEEGLKHWKKKGMEMERRRIVLNRLRLKFPLDVIASASGLTIEEVEALASEIPPL